MTKPTILVATPMYGGMCTGAYVSGLLQNLQTLSDNGIAIQWAHLTNESLIPRARNEMVRMFLETKHDYLMFIDADISFPHDGILKLLEVDKDVVCGIYPKKEVDWEGIKRAAKEGKENLQDYAGSYVVNVAEGEVTSDERGGIEIRHGGTGFMLIKRKVFDGLKAHTPTYRPGTDKNENGDYKYKEVSEFFATSIKDGILLSEDWHFCELVRSWGMKVYANPFIKLDHIGTYTYSGSLTTKEKRQ